MKYISGIYGLNTKCNLETMGDWHCSSLNWSKPLILESDNSVFKDFGIEYNKKIPEHNETYNVANHIRACLDLIEQGNFGIVEGMNKDYISNSKYDNLIFEKVYLLKDEPNFTQINDFMLKEYRMKWVNFCKISNINRLINNNNNDDIINSTSVDLHCINKITYNNLLKFQNKAILVNLYNIIFLIKNHWEKLSDTTKDNIKDSFSHKGIDYFEMLLETQSDELIDKEKLQNDFIDIWDKVGLSENDDEDFVDEYEIDYDDTEY